MELGVPKKSLDDYMMVCKEAYYEGFNFFLNKEKQITFLRDFLRKLKQENKKKGKS